LEDSNNQISNVASNQEVAIITPKQTINSITQIDDRQFVAPKEILHMYQKMSMVSFKIWTCLISDVANKNYTTNKTNLPISQIWGTLGARLSFKRLNDRLNELQQTLITQDEYLPQVEEFERVTFQALGETRVTTDKNDDVTSLEYQMMNGLMSMLDSTDKERFIIEMNVFRSLKGDDGAKAAKNLLLFCTPYVFNGKTPEISFIDLKAFMDMSDCYINQDGTHNTKEFNRKVLKKAQGQVNDNPFINFNIDSIVPIKEGKKSIGCYFNLSKRKSVLPSLVPTDIDLSIPLNPKQIHTILENYWRERQNNPNLYYERDILEDTLSRLHLVNKYINKYIEDSGYNDNPVNGTYQIFSVVTAIFQLWIEGFFKKEGSKIYKYTISVFSNPKVDQIQSLVQRYFESTKISSNNIMDEQQKQTHRRKSLECVKRLSRVVNKYKRDRFDVCLAYLGEEGVQIKDNSFREKLSKGIIRNIWACKALDAKPSDIPVAEVLPRNSLDFYKDWLVNQCASDGDIPDKTVNDFLLCFPDSIRDITFLKLSVNIDFYFFEKNILDLSKQLK